MHLLPLVAVVCAAVASAETVRLSGLSQPVEILRDKWGVPHLYARSQDDLFLAQGYVAARDRLFQIDLWRRAGTGKLAEAAGSGAISRDWLARSIRYRGDLAKEWASYGPDTERIVTAFTSGINAYIRSLRGQRPREFQLAGYDPGLWTPDDCIARVAGLQMVQNPVREVQRVLDLRVLGIQTLQRYLAPDPPVALEVPNGLDPNDIGAEVLTAYTQALGEVAFASGVTGGSNNWVVDGAMTATGKPLLASDPHRPVNLPSLRKTIHLVAPGWNAIGAGEPALPGIALGHNNRIAFGFTIVGTDQADLYVETLDPGNPNRYRYRGLWKEMDIERQDLAVKGLAKPHRLELRYTVHGPVIHEDRARNRAYVLRWVGAEPGAAGYLAGLSLARAGNWAEFRAAVERYKVPSENLVYADIDGNIGWHATGLTPVRRNWSGLFPVPGAAGDYEWEGFRPMKDLPQAYNPATHFIATANHNILPPKFPFPLAYEWAPALRYQRIVEMLSQPGKKFTVADFERMQQDVVSLAARRFQNVLRAWNPKPGTREAQVVALLLKWDTRMTTDSTPALIYAVWIARIVLPLFGPRLGARVELPTVLETLEKTPNPKALSESLADALRMLENGLGPDRNRWQWGRVHQIVFRHPLGARDLSRGPFPRPGDAYTVNATSGLNFLQTNGASFRQVIDLADWERSTMTNVPGESGDPLSPHYSDLIVDWNGGRYHPMPFSRNAVEAVTEEKILLVPVK